MHRRLRKRPLQKPLQQQEQALKEAQRLAVASGSATVKHGKAFWTIKAARS